MPSKEKLKWEGTIISVQPRIRLIRSFDQSSHNYLGYMLLIDGKIDQDIRIFTEGIGKATQFKFEFRNGDEVSGNCLPVNYPEKESVDYYKVAALKVIRRSSEENNPPPWTNLSPTLEEYRARGHRRLSKQTYNSKCLSCIWGCCMSVEIIIDQWQQDKVKYRYETFCYGPKSCKYYKAGPNRKVPGRKGMVWEEPDWVDEQAIDHRDLDE